MPIVEGIDDAAVRARAELLAGVPMSLGDVDGQFRRAFNPHFGFLRPIIPEVVNKFLDCCDLEHGFARDGRFHVMPEADPLPCPKCQKEMRIVSLIDEQAVIERILRHLGLWQQGVRIVTGPDSPADWVIP